MSFHKSFNHLHINTRPGHTVLEGTTHDERGLEINSQILLDDYIGNSNGRFVWGGRNFSRSADNDTMTLSNTPHGAILRAHLLKDDETWSENQRIDLSEKIANLNGKLRVV
ncbi:hypothetical protein CNMCM5793_000325 [Aspergillus hiratsukae]|uniref:Cyanovirin-N domain-containing protein n=1 Tax=Aspergillus hiratsukae TaxID=1194566 RepID=A0A8H6PY06_9EURO|nr:hypothetical protein CNMCM5793_000325 [Aspergillus hiratsukae]KAF7163290.1 hypothetical protein CNMCM6106_000238 [Aspergillus hiratsukae]